MANVTADAETREMGRKIVHHDAPGILGWQSLCGHVDRTDYRWKSTKAKVNCHACIAVVNYAAALRQPAQPVAIPLDNWHEDDGAKLWWAFPICEAPHVGTPIDDDWPGYHTHYTDYALPAVLNPTDAEGEK